MLAGAWRRGKAHEPLIIVSCCITMVFMNWHMVGPVLPRFALDFGVTIAEVSLLISAFTLARVFLNFPAGALTERVGRRGVFLAGGLLVGLASIGSGLVNDFSHLVLLRFLTGAGGAIAVTVQSTIMVDISTRANRGRMMSFSEGVVSLGLFLGPAAGGLLGDSLGLRVPFFVSGVLTLLLTAWAALRLPETRGWNAEMTAHLAERAATRVPVPQAGRLQDHHQLPRSAHRARPQPLSLLRGPSLSFAHSGTYRSLTNDKAGHCYRGPGDAPRSLIAVSQSFSSGSRDRSRLCLQAKLGGTASCHG